MEYSSKSLENIKNIHFIGIGGSGMFPMACILKHKGFNISGSDVYESDTLQKVRDLGIKVFIGHKPENLQGTDMVVYSAAIKPSNPEIIEAKKLNIPVIERCVMLRIINSYYNNSISVAGTHGKTSTTSMITSILIDAGKSPTAIIGGSLSKINGNSCIGTSDTIVCEACEYVDSFLQLNPSVSVIQNVEADHLDYFKTFDNFKNSFKKFAQQTTNLLIVNGDDVNAREVVEGAKAKKIFYGFSKDNDYYIDNLKFDSKQFATFTIAKNNQSILSVSLKVPGKHNIYNALAAAIVTINCGVSYEKISESLSNFSGVHRRFEILYNKNDIVVADDFAHHPTEIKNILSTTMNMGFKRVWAVFQPHTFSRTFLFLDEFAKVLSMADRVVLSEILPVREVNTYNIYSEDLAKKIPGCVCLKTFDEITDFILKNVAKGDLVLTLGGGNIYKCANSIVAGLNVLNN